MSLTKTYTAGGQAFMVKLRKTSMRTPTSMLIEPPYTLNGSTPDPNLPARWRHLKYVVFYALRPLPGTKVDHGCHRQACGESPRAYGNRMDTMWSFRSAYEEARKVRDAQDMFCARAEAGLWNEIQGQSYPEDLRWEALVDVLRGRVKVSTHCYEPVDLDGIVRVNAFICSSYDLRRAKRHTSQLTQEFKFPIASFHHAHEAYLVPDALKNT